MAIEHLAPSPLRGSGLPPQPGVLVGRTAEVRWIREHLRSDVTRLVTLVGPAGTGKTRLAVEVAGEVADAFPDGVYFVDLAPLRDEALLASAIAQALDVRAQPERPLVDVLKVHLAQRRVLLLLDNFEQLLLAAPLLSDLLQTSRALTLLVTSRSPLHLRWEQEFAVSPLALPSLAPLPPPANWPASARSRCLSSAPNASIQRFDSTKSTRARSPRSAFSWTACRWPSSSPRHVRGCCRRSRC